MSMTDEAEADEVTVVENILNGVYSHPAGWYFKHRRRLGAGRDRGHCGGGV